MANPTEVKRERNPNTGNIKVTYSDGSTKIEYAPYGNSKQYIEDNNYYGTPLETNMIEQWQDSNPHVGGYGKQNRSYETFYGSNKDLLDQFEKETRRKYDINKNEDAAWFQPRFKEQTYNDAVSAGYPPEIAKQIANEVAFNDAKGKDPRKLDSKTGDWTKSRMRVKFKPYAPEERPRVEIPTREAVVNTPPGDIRAEHLADVNIPEIPDDFWLQDKIKVAGAFGDMMRVKKYMPWQAQYNPTLMDPTFYDPTRELAANSSAANTASQAIGMYAGPQAMNARLAQVQGNASKNAADILGRYNNQNVTVANQFEQANAGIMNQYAADEANQKTNLFDKNTIVNQQFDSEKNMARQNLRQGYIDAVTNRANTQALNSMRDNHYVDPRSGGYVNFWHGRKYKPETPIDRSKQLSQLLNDYMNAGWTREEAIAAINKQVAG